MPFKRVLVRWQFVVGCIIWTKQTSFRDGGPNAATPPEARSIIHNAQTWPKDLKLVTILYSVVMSSPQVQASQGVHPQAAHTGAVTHRSPRSGVATGRTTLRLAPRRGWCLARLALRREQRRRRDVAKLCAVTSMAECGTTSPADLLQ